MRKCVLSLLLIFTLILNPLTAAASSSSASTDVSAARSSNFTVTIPKKISMKVDGSDASASYTVSIVGDLAGSDIVKVTPPATFNMTSNSKSVQANVSQNRDYFSLADMSNLQGSISVAGLTAGDWIGYFYFNIDCTLSDVEQSTEDSTNETLCSHNFEYADCESLGVCTLCGESTVSARGHVAVTDPCFCDYCGEVMEGITPVETVDGREVSVALCEHGTYVASPKGVGTNSMASGKLELSDENKALVSRAVILDGITCVDAFGGCSNLTTLGMSDSVTSIGAYAFEDCTSLRANEVLREGITSIAAYAFDGCSSLGDVVLPESCTNYGEGAFANSGMTSLTIPPTFTMAGSRPWANCPQFTKAIFKEGCTFVPMCMFATNCNALTEVELPSTMLTIRQEAFSGSGLQTINIPDSVQSIEYRAFANCSNIQELTVPNTVTDIAEYAFDGIPVVKYNGTAANSPWGALSVVTE